MEELAKENKAMQEVVHTLREMSADEYERRLAEQLEKDERDRRAEIAYGRDEGFEEGLEKGEARGKAQVMQQTAQRMREKGYSEDEIAELVGY